MTPVAAQRSSENRAWCDTTQEAARESWVLLLPPRPEILYVILLPGPCHWAAAFLGFDLGEVEPRRLGLG